MKLNNKGMSIVEIVVTFTIIMFLVIGLMVIIVNYRNKVAVSLERLDLDTLKYNITQDINNDILTYGVKEITDDTHTTDTNSPCYNLMNVPANSNEKALNRCITITFNNNTKKAFGTSKVEAMDENSIVNKYLYYDGLKYKIKDRLPEKIPTGENAPALRDLAQISIFDDAILNSDYTVLEDGNSVTVYTIDVYISHIDFNDDFGIHIIASTDNVSL